MIGRWHHYCYLTPRMSREQTAELFASRATEGSELDSLVMHVYSTLNCFSMPESTRSYLS